ncbi:MAG: sulfatase [Planctomycetota bacterium]
MPTPTTDATVRRRRVCARVLATLALLASAALGTGCDEGGGKRPPNVVLVVIDTARADHFSCYGYERETTPRIDAFARQDAVLYRDARSAAPWTLPSHASLFTGLWPGEHGMNWTHWISPEVSLKKGLHRSPDLPDPDRLIAKRLAARGYRTFGLSNNSWVSERSGLDDGFEIFVDAFRDTKSLPKGYADWPSEWKVPQPLQTSSAGRTIALAKREIANVGPNEPFFLFFNFIEPHFPYQPPKPFRGRFGGTDAMYERQARELDDREREIMIGAVSVDTEEMRVAYDEELATVDRAVGHLVDWLREIGRYDDTLVVVTSDHGEHLGEGGRWSHQLSVERELLWVPLIVKYPHGEGAGTVVDDRMVSNVDVWSTILRVAGADTSGADPHRSRDLRDATPRDWFLSEYDYSDFFLEELVALDPRFDPSPYRTISRVVFEDGDRLDFDRTTWRSTRAAVPGRSPVEHDPAPFEKMLSTYQDEIDAIEFRYRSGKYDPATLENLAELGYISRPKPDDEGSDRSEGEGSGDSGGTSGGGR